jgi:ADP-ribose pyrophosphatase
MGNDKPQAWEVLDEKELGEFEIFSVRRLRTRSPRDGGEHDFHVADAPDGVVVLALTDDEQLVMVKQWRHPLQRVTLEAPSGIMDPGESAAEAAVRELREETGYEGGEPEPLGALVLNPSWQTTRLHAVVISGVRRTSEKELDEGEDTRVACIPLARIRQSVLDGEIDSATVVAALALWQWRHREPRFG